VTSFDLGGGDVATQFASVDEYIASLPEDVKGILEEIRRRVRAAVPEAGERISYQIPTFTLGGRSLVYVAAWKQHVAVYPIPEGDDALQREIAPYQSGKGTLKFPVTGPIPYDLIDRLVACLVAERTPRG
jgi:uncharacterized protein YdhG (YjbR/CyaY superfamily)